MASRFTGHSIATKQLWRFSHETVTLLVFLFAAAAFGQVNKAALMKPATLNERAPNLFKVKFDTTVGQSS